MTQAGTSRSTEGKRRRGITDKWEEERDSPLQEGYCEVLVLYRMVSTIQ